MRKVKKIFSDGYLTVFLSMIAAVLLSLFLALIEGARYRTAWFEAACVTDIGLNSILAEYHCELLDQYNVFAIDSSYLTEYAAKANTERHLREYIDRNLSVEGIFLADLLYRDFLKMNAEKVEITGVSMLSDNNGEVFRKCAVNAIKDDVGIAMLEDLKNWMEEVELNNLDGKDLEAEKDAVDTEIEQRIREIREYNQKQKDKKDIEDEYEDYQSPTAFLDGIRKQGILKLTINDPGSLSGKKINAQDLIESRIQRDQISMGNMPVRGNTALENVEEQFFFHEYLIKYLGCFGREKEDGALDYQLEYLLGGKEDDIANLRITANRICLLRESANVLYLYSDDVKSGQADALAAVIAFLTGAPEVKDLIKTSIILGWAYAESIYDVKMLFSGGKIPLMKSDDTWHYSLTNALSLWSEEEDYKTGLSYEDYLRVILMLEDSDRLTMRAMNMIEADIRETKENKNFRLDACYSAVKVFVKIKSHFGYSFEMTREKSYEPD